MDPQRGRSDPRVPSEQEGRIPSEGGNEVRRLGLGGIALIAITAGCTPISSGPTSTPSTTAPVWLAAGCLDSATPGRLDLDYSGTPNLHGNLRPHHSTDGTCTGPPIYYDALVRASSQAEADEACGAIEAFPLAHQLALAEISGPADAYICDTGSASP
jgi:hypothetical protein